MRLLLSLICAVVFLCPKAAFAQNALPVIEDGDYYNFYSTRTNPRCDDKLPLDVHADYTDTIAIVYTPVDPNEWRHRSTLADKLLYEGFAEADVKFINEQIKKTRGYTWTEKSIGGFVFTDVKAKKAGKHFCNSFGVPLFSIDKSKCFVKEGMVSRKSSGIYFFSVYKLVDDKWELSTIFYRGTRMG